MNRPEHIDGAGRDACRDCRALLHGLRVVAGPHPYLIREGGRGGSDSVRYRCLICGAVLRHDEAAGRSRAWQLAPQHRRSSRPPEGANPPPSGEPRA